MKKKLFLWSILLVLMMASSLATMTVVSPVNNGNYTNPILFNVTLSNGSVDATNVTALWYLNGVNIQNTTINNDTSQDTIFDSSVNPGNTNMYLNLTFQAYNASGDQVVPEVNVTNILVDVTKPYTVQIETTNATGTNSLTPTISFNTTDNIASALTCSAYVGGNLNGSSVSASNATSTNINLSFTSSGEYNYYINCSDYPGNTNISSTFQINVDLTNPVVQTMSPSWTTLNISNSNASLVNFTLNITDVELNLQTVYIAVTNGSSPFNLTTSNISSIFNTTLFNLSQLAANTSHNLTVYANDTLGNINNSIVFTINKDGVPPTVSSISASNTGTTTGNVSITATDSLTSISSCVYNTGGANTSLSQSGNIFRANITGLSASTAYTVTTYCTDVIGNLVTNSTSFTTSAAASSGGSSSGGSSGGGAPGASNSVGTSVPGQFAKEIWTSIKSGETATVEVEGDLGVTEVEFGLAETRYGVVFEVKAKDSFPSEVKSFSNKVYKKIEIKPGNSIKEGDVVDAKVNFKVSKAWLTEEGTTKENVALHRYVGEEWTELSTSVSSEDDEFVYFTAETPGFSYFLIGTKSADAESVVKEAVEETNEAEPQETDNPQEGPSKGTPMWIWPVLGLIVLGIIIYLTQKKKR